MGQCRMLAARKARDLLSAFGSSCTVAVVKVTWTELARTLARSWCILATDKVQPQACSMSSSPTVHRQVLRACVTSQTRSSGSQRTSSWSKEASCLSLQQRMPSRRASTGEVRMGFSV